MSKAKTVNAPPNENTAKRLRVINGSLLAALDQTKPSEPPVRPISRLNVRLTKEWDDLWQNLKIAFPNRSDSDLIRDGLRALAAIALEVDESCTWSVFCFDGKSVKPLRKFLHLPEDIYSKERDCDALFEVEKFFQEGVPKPQERKNHGKQSLLRET